MIVSQTDFRASLLDPARAVPDGLQNADGAPATKRFDVYRNNVAVSLSDVLESAFPVVRKLVGDEFFRAMVGVFLRKHPPKTPMVMLYGDAMPVFLSRFGPAKPLKYLPDVARLEMAIRHSYHAADADPIDAQALAALDPEKLMGTKLRLAPSVRVVTSDHPILAIQRANTDDAAPKPVWQAESVLVTRPGFDPQMHLINGAAATCITALIKGDTLGVAMTLAGDDLDLGGLLSLLLGQHAITGLS